LVEVLTNQVFNQSTG